MTDSLTNPADKIGLPPGSLIYVGDTKHFGTKISVVDYNSNEIEELKITSVDEIIEYNKSGSIRWVTVCGLSDTELIGQIGMLTNIHPLVVEDILTTHQRPKFEEYEHYLYIVLNSFIFESAVTDLESEQISLLVFKDSVFIFRENSDDLFYPIIKRIKSGRGRIREMGADYLAYSIIDIIVDKFFVLTEIIDDKITQLEDSLLASELLQDTPLKIQKLKKDLIFIKKNISPTKELTTGMLRSESKLIHEKTKLYLRDVADHATRLNESAESYRDILSGLLAVHMSCLSNKMNEVMKVLTVFASIFTPLTFLAGIYGMNFEYMPELKFKWAYPALLILFITIPACLLIYFRKKKWL